MNRGLLLKEGERIDDLERNGYGIIQNPSRFCFGMDAVLLSGWANAAADDRVLDLGTGTGIIPILMAAKTRAGSLTGLEIQPESVDMARRSVLMNALEGRVEIVHGDIRGAQEIFGAASFDVITCNPPYMKAEAGIKNPQEPRAIARHEILCSLEDVIREAAGLLRAGGHFYMVHRPFRLTEILGLMSRYSLEAKRLRMVHPYIDREPGMLLIEGVKGSRPYLRIEKPLIIYEGPGRYSREIREEYGY